ncbi:MAG: cytochrome B, partial [Cytophagales bacterium]|nr:cytochrome B [Cytophagales bacterium]
ISLVWIIVRSLAGWLNKTGYVKLDDQLGLGLFMLTHTQLLLGIILFFVSPIVIFSGASMKDPTLRYWLVEHNTGMLIAVVLITIARITSKKMTDSISKHKRMFIFNGIALVIILLMILQSKRGFFGITY